MLKCHIRDSNFFSNANPEKPNPYIDWIWDRVPTHSAMTAFTDSHLHEVHESTSIYKIALLFEPPAISHQIYEWIKKASNYTEFDLIFSFDKSLQSIDDRFNFYPYGTTWIYDDQRRIYDKSKLCSIIASNKTVTVGQMLRHDAIRKFKNKFDVFGRAYNPIEHKIQGLQEYRYSIAIENCRIETYFTEKIMDCFMTGTIPLYYGCPGIDKIFNSDGIYQFETLEELDGIMANISEADYQSRLDAIEDNFLIAKEFLDFEKHLVIK